MKFSFPWWKPPASDIRHHSTCGPKRFPVFVCHVFRNCFLFFMVLFVFFCFFNRPGGQDRKQNSQNHKRTRTAYFYSRLSAHLIHGTRPSWWHSAQLLFSIHPWTSSQLLFSRHPWTSSQLLFSIHPWTSSQCELNTPVGLRPSCELNTPVGLRPSCDLNTPFGLRPSCQLNTPVSVRLSYELNTPVGLRPSCANLQYTPLPFPYLFPIESHRFKKKVLLKIIDFHHTHTTHNHTRTHTITHAHEQ